MTLTPHPHLTPTLQCLITENGRLGDNKYLDPRTGQSFSFDHLRKSTTDVEAADVDDCDGFRSAFEEAVTQYTKDHYMKGVRRSCLAKKKFFLPPPPLRRSASRMARTRWPPLRGLSSLFVFCTASLQPRAGTRVPP